MEATEIAKIVGIFSTGAIAVGGIFKLFILPRASHKEKAETAKLDLESKLLKKTITEDSVDLIKKGYEGLLEGHKKMVETQDEVIEGLRTELNTLKDELTKMRSDYNEIRKSNDKIRIENNNLKIKLNKATDDIAQLKEHKE